MRYFIIGADGQLGRELVRTLQNHNHEVISLTRSDIDISDEASVQHALRDVDTGACVINTAANANIYDCEVNKEAAWNTNALGPRYLSIETAKRDARLVHLSSDYVFDGDTDTPYLPSDTPNPINYYGVTKYASEQMVLEHNSQSLIVRTSGIFGITPSRIKGNFFSNLLKRYRAGESLHMVNDQFITPTFAPELADQILRYVECGQLGITHVTQQGVTTWWDMAVYFMARVDPTVSVTPRTTGWNGESVRRPQFSALLPTPSELYRMSPWQHTVDVYIKQLDDLTLNDLY